MKKSKLPDADEAVAMVMLGMAFVALSTAMHKAKPYLPAADSIMIDSLMKEVLTIVRKHTDERIGDMENAYPGLGKE